MSFSDSVSRLTGYFRRRGLASTIGRVGVAIKRALFANRMVVLFCDLDERRLPAVNVPKSFRVERLRTLCELSEAHRYAITAFWNPKLASRSLVERFEKGASLWLVESDGQLAGYGWTLRGKTIAEYYFPLGSDDEQLFDFYVFPKFRGRAIHWLLTGHILHTLAVEGRSRAFADTHEWNQAQLASFKMTSFRPLGLVRTYTIFGKIFTSWATIPRSVSAGEGVAPVNKATRMLRSNE